MRSNPWMKFYPSDWRADQALRLCSVAARGLWIEMLCVMHEANPYGFLKINGVALSLAQLAALAATSRTETARLLVELETAGVFSRNRDGVIYSRRMVRDDKKRKDGEKAAKTGLLPSSRRGRQLFAKTKKNQPPLGVVKGGGAMLPLSPESRIQNPESSLRGKAGQGKAVAIETQDREGEEAILEVCGLWPFEKKS